MSITYRGNGAWGTGKGGPLTASEFDVNTFTLKSLIDALVADPPGAVTVTNVSATGSQVTFSFSDSSEFTVTVPTATTPVPSPVETVTGTTFTPATANANRYMRCTNPAGCVVTIPANAAVSYPTGTELHFRQVGAEGLIFTGAVGVTVNTPDGFDNATAAVGSTVTIKKVAANEWDLFGLLAVETTSA
jgi:hypothetical protein